MASMQRRSISGTSLLSSTAEQRTIALPLLPENRAWSITGAEGATTIAWGWELDRVLMSLP